MHIPLWYNAVFGAVHVFRMEVPGILTELAMKIMNFDFVASFKGINPSGESFLRRSGMSFSKYNNTSKKDIWAVYKDCTCERLYVEYSGIREFL